MNIVDKHKKLLYAHISVRDCIYQHSEINTDVQMLISLIYVQCLRGAYAVVSELQGHGLECNPLYKNSDKGTHFQMSL